MRKSLFVVMFALVFWTKQAKAQCAPSGSVTTNTSSTPRTCGGNESITAAFTNISKTLQF